MQCRDEEEDQLTERVPGIVACPHFGEKNSHHQIRKGHFPIITCILQRSENQVIDHCFKTNKLAENVVNKGLEGTIASQYFKRLLEKPVDVFEDKKRAKTL